MKTIIGTTIAILIAVSGVLASEIPAKQQDHPIAIVGATIHPVSGPVIDNGTILFEKGKITALGANVTVPQGAEVVDGKGKHVYPGFIDAHTNLGLTEIGAVRATNDISESGSLNPNVRAEAAVNPESEILPVTRANGITTAVTYPDGGVISGTAAAISMDGWTWEDLTVKAPVGLVVNWPQMTINHAWWEQRSEEDQKKARDKAMNELRNAFRDARAYVKAKRSETATGVPYHNTDLRWESMEPVLDGKIPVLVNADEIQQIESAIAWADQENLKIVIVGGYDSWRAANLLKARNIPVIVNPIMRTPWRRGEEYDDPATLPKKLYDAGVSFCIAGEAGASNERNLPYQAAMASSYGLPKDEALKSVILAPAQILGIADRQGSLEVGKDATLFVSDGDPLEIMTNITMEYIQGKNISLESRHTRLNQKYEEKYRRIPKPTKD
ncbi:MAG TPA: amidohydrolase family protein [Bacteroidota bacterium]|jgi:imidazolonepropionase-like amidohydrolase|nr:amidohydrolase family protein [Bacteroidota bacterium]